MVSVLQHTIVLKQQKKREKNAQQAPAWLVQRLLNLLDYYLGLRDIESESINKGKGKKLLGCLSVVRVNIICCLGGVWGLRHDTFRI